MTPAAAVGIAIAGIATIAYAFLWEPNWLSVTRVDVRLDRLSAPGLTIGHLSDLHLGTPAAAARTRRAVQMLMASRPDLVVLTGDFVSSREGLDMIAVLAPLRAPLGVYAVLGNHDHWIDPDGVEDALARLGIEVLRNRSVRLEIEGHPIWLIGLDDMWNRLSDLETASAGIPPQETRLLLVHEPDFAAKTPPGRVDLQLSGHSHGGQVRIPFKGALLLPPLGRHYPAGLQWAGTTAVYTNRGLGTVSPHARFHCRPEITLLRLVPDRSAPQQTAPR